MGKTDVYSWRVSPETKMALELEARREGTSLGEILQRIAQEWLDARRQTLTPQDGEQARIRAAAGKAIGEISGGDSRRAERARVTVRRRLMSRRSR